MTDYSLSLEKNKGYDFAVVNGAKYTAINALGTNRFCEACPIARNIGHVCHLGDNMGALCREIELARGCHVYWQPLKEEHTKLGIVRGLNPLFAKV